MKNKKVASAAQAVEDIFDGATVLIGGFGRAGVTVLLLEALCERGLRGLTLAHNNSGHDHVGIARLIQLGCVAKVSTHGSRGKLQPPPKGLKNEVADHFEPAGGRSAYCFCQPFGIATGPLQPSDGRTKILSKPDTQWIRFRQATANLRCPIGLDAGLTLISMS